MLPSMKVLGRDMRAGRVKVRVETEDDLWHLYNLVEIGDMVVASTHRREEKKSDKIRAERAGKRRMTLGIRVEKLEFHDFDLRLRILGLIEEGMQDIGSHHTLNVEVDEILTIVKTWRRSHLDRLQRAVEDAQQPQVMFVALDEDEATLAAMRQFGMQEIAQIRSSRTGKQYATKDEGDYYGEIIAKLRQSCRGAPMVLLGPGFAKEELLHRGKLEEPELFHRAFAYHTGQSGMAGVHELMKRGLGKEVLEDSRMAMEVALVDDILSAIAKDDPVAYGPEEVETAAEAGAVETLAIIDSLVRDQDVDRLIRKVENSRGRVVMISEHHDAGKGLEAISGIAALLRYRV